MRYKVNPEHCPGDCGSLWAKFMEKQIDEYIRPLHQRAIIDHLNAGHDLQIIVPRSAFKPTKKETK